MAFLQPSARVEGETHGLLLVVLIKLVVLREVGEDERGMFFIGFRYEIELGHDGTGAFQAVEKVLPLGLVDKSEVVVRRGLRIGVGRVLGVDTVGALRRGGFGVVWINFLRHWRAVRGGCVSD